VPSLRGAGLKGGYHYYDAQTDDARLVLRVLREAVRRGGVALNYARASSLLRDSKGQVQGVVLTDGVSGRTAEVKARAVVNATGAWADGLRGHVGQKKRLRIIRGSHLCFDRARLPLDSAITMLHPKDGRAVFAVPWEGVSLVGTTDVDHPAELGSEPHISAEETEYLMNLARHAFPSLDLTRKDVVSTYAGVRGVIDTGASDPSKESREHALWMEDGLLTVTGGKLTTFRVMAREVLHALQDRLGKEPDTERILDDASELELPTTPEIGARLLGRHGIEATEILAAPEKDEAIDGTPALWSELRHAARSEGVVRLEDLLLRRVRLGILMPNGGVSVMDRVKEIAQKELGWDDSTWAREEAAYRATWKKNYAVID
jgi:glycerol-3-phosphate dehydrogenase